MKGQQKHQDAALQPTSLQDLLALALASIHEALWVRDAEGFCTSAQDAASFWSTCKRVDEVAQLPSMLKLSFMDSVPNLSGLALMLSKQGASGTRVSLRMLTSDEEAFYQDADKESQSIPSTFLNLSALGSRLVHLDIPCIRVACILDNVREKLVQLKHLTLRVSAFHSWTEMKKKVKWYNGNQLSNLVLSVPPQSRPFVLYNPCHLQDFPVLRQFVLRGPVVKDGDVYEDHDDDDLFVLSPKTKVIIDPGLEGRKPTPWARQLTTHESPADMRVMLGSAIPLDDEYQEEDEDARKERIRAFQDKVVQRAIELEGGPSFMDDFIDGFVSGMLSGPGLEGFMEGAGCYYRSDILLERHDVEFIAQHALKESRVSFRKCVLEGMVYDYDGYDGMW